jgi:hypothetical protein
MSNRVNKLQKPAFLSRGVAGVVVFTLAAAVVTDFAAFGRMTTRISPSGLSGVWNGVLRGLADNEDGRGNRVVTCTAQDHGVVLSR